MAKERRTTPRGPARRAEILEGLVEIFLAEGFLAFSLDDLAARLQCSKSTLYAVAPSKEQLTTAVVRTFFREATARVDERAAAVEDPADRIEAYLHAISEELAPASSWFFADVNTFAPARDIYAHNTAIAAARVHQMVTAAAEARDATAAAVNGAFLGAVTRSVMESIQRGALEEETGLQDAAAYQLLADLIVAGVNGDQERNRS